MGKTDFINDAIEIIGASENNLKHIDVTIPKGKLVVFAGVSGSGKSSLAFDTKWCSPPLGSHAGVACQWIPTSLPHSNVSITQGLSYNCGSRYFRHIQPA